MKKLIVWVGYAAFLLCITGCLGPLVKSSGSKVIPPEITGTWKAYDSPWKIELSPNGKVVSAVIPMGIVEVKPNKTTKVEMKDGQFSTYKTGDFDVQYTADTRELFVSIEVKDMHIVFLHNVIDGNSIDNLVGPVSEDGKTWKADWINVFDYGPRFPQDPNSILAGQLLFEKVED